MPDMHKKVGPFPLYVWLGIGTVAILGAYFYLHGSSSSGTSSSTVGTDGTSDASTALDPTTGLPYSGGVAGSGSTGVSADTAGTQPTISDEINDVTSLISALQGSGMLSQPPAPVYDDSGIRADLAQMQAAMQAGANHDAPTPVAARTGSQTTSPVKVVKAPSTPGLHDRGLSNVTASRSGAVTSPSKAAAKPKMVTTPGGQKAAVGSHVTRHGNTYRVGSTGALIRV